MITQIKSLLVLLVMIVVAVMGWRLLRPAPVVEGPPSLQETMSLQEMMSVMNYIRESKLLAPQKSYDDVRDPVEPRPIVTIPVPVKEAAPIKPPVKEAEPIKTKPPDYAVARDYGIVYGLYVDKNDGEGFRWKESFWTLEECSSVAKATWESKRTPAGCKVIALAPPELGQYSQQQADSTAASAPSSPSSQQELTRAQRDLIRATEQYVDCKKTKPQRWCLGQVFKDRPMDSV